MVGIYYFSNIKPCITWQNSTYYPILKKQQIGFLKRGCKYRWSDAVIYLQFCNVINHPILLKRLEFSFGIKEKALTCVKLYLADRIQCVSVANKTLPDVGLLFGVPQGSVLRPKNYYMYTKPVGEIIKRYNIKYHCYANDAQVYMTLKSCDK